MKKTRTLAALLWLWLAAAAPARADLPPVKQVGDQPVIEYQPGTPGRVSFLRGAKAQYETPHAKIGVLQDGWHCGSSSDIIWDDKAFRLFSKKLDKSFHSVLEQAHYPTPVTLDTVFAAPTAQAKPKRMPELQVGMLIKNIEANLCLQDHGSTGGVYMKVFWQAYSPETGKVEFEGITEGSFQTGAGQGIAADQIFLKAFEQSARNLLAEQGFYKVVTQASPKAAPGGGDTLALKRIAPPAQPLTKNVTLLRSAVVTVLNSTGSGSGFFISADGYLLTNRHVVGTEKFVKVKLATGRELVGEVLRSDAARDVALIKTEPIGVPALSLRDDEANIGEELYVLGSPLGERFSTTLTRGILSGYRTMDQQRYLQSDVAILPGNSGGPLLDTDGRVVGIAVRRLANATAMTGISFFIPIGEALTTLGLELN